MQADEFVELITQRYIKGSTILYFAKDNKIQKEKMIKNDEGLEENILASVNSDDSKFDSDIDEDTTLQPEESGKCLKIPFRYKMLRPMLVHFTLIHKFSTRYLTFHGIGVTGI